MAEISRCRTESDFVIARQVVEEYAAWLDMDLGFQDFEAELEGFSSVYGPPRGVFLLAWVDGEPAGGVGMRELGAGVCEMKRLFVYDRFRGCGLGRRLCAALVGEASRMGYTRMRLDTVARLAAANRLYERMGFSDTGAYRYNPDPTARYMELRLGQAGPPGRTGPPGSTGPPGRTGKEEA